MNALKYLAIATTCLSLLACGGGGGGGGGGSSLSSGGGSSSASDAGRNAEFTLRVTDAPIDDIVAVVLQFTEVRLRQSNGNWIDFQLDTPKSIDLLQLQGKSTSDLLSGKSLPRGRYDEIRLLVDTAPMANYVDLGAGGLKELKVPSGSSSGLKITGDFTLQSEVPMTMVVDFDLRRSIVMAGKSGKYIMKPVLRMVNADEVGHVSGKVNVSFLTSTPACSDNDVDTYNAVYVFDGHDVLPEDIDESSNIDIDPIATTRISWKPASGTYEYEAAFLPAGEYTLAMTCNANLDDLDQGGDDLKFFIVRNVTVSAM